MTVGYETASFLLVIFLFYELGFHSLALLNMLNKVHKHKNKNYFNFSGKNKTNMALFI